MNEVTNEMKKTIGTIINKIMSMNFYEPHFKATLLVNSSGLALHRESSSFPWTHGGSCWATTQEDLDHMKEWLDKEYQFFKSKAKSPVSPEAEEREHWQDLELNIRRGL